MNTATTTINKLHSTEKPLGADIESGMATNYNHYFSTGTYLQRYPQVNLHTLAFSQCYINQQNPDLHILDYGCGSGRYLMILLKRYPLSRFSAYDISSMPLKLLRENLSRIKASNRVKVTDRYEDILENNPSENVETKSRIDVALLLFGVLSHIESGTKRQAILKDLSNHIDPKSGYLLLSVPNMKRRFLNIQKQQKSNEITYSRQIDDQESTFYYHLYSVETICKELSDAGLNVVEVRPESIFPESWVTRFPTLGWIDHQLCKVLPAQWGYGILIACQTK